MELEEFDAASMIKPPFRAIFIGRSNTGKSESSLYWIKQLHDSKKIDAVIVFTGTKFNNFWSPVTPMVFDGWDPAFVDKLLTTRQEKIAAGGKVNELLIVLDDLIDNEYIDLHKDKQVASLYTRGRHSHISIMVITQKMRKLSSTIRVNTEYTCILNASNRMELLAIEEEYNTGSKEDFFKLFKEYVHSYQFLVVSSAGYDTTIYVDKATLVRDFNFPRFHRGAKLLEEKRRKQQEQKKGEAEPKPSHCKDSNGVCRILSKFEVELEGIPKLSQISRSKKKMLRKVRR